MLHRFSTSRQFSRDGFDAALVVTVPSLKGTRVGPSVGAKGATVTALATRADGAIVDSSGTFYVFAGGRAFGIPSPTALAAARAADKATPLTGPIGTAETRASIAGGVLLSDPGKVYVSYQGNLYQLKTQAQLVADGYGGTARGGGPGPRHAQRRLSVLGIITRSRTPDLCRSGTLGPRTASAQRPGDHPIEAVSEEDAQPIKQMAVCWSRRHRP